MLRLTRLRLQDFRSYQRLDWVLDQGEAGKIVVIDGPNGSGKTNLLEAISLLAPGRGLRGARIADLARRDEAGAAASWGIAAWLDGPAGPVQIGTGGGAASGERRDFRLDAHPPRSQAEVAARVGFVWLTPQMDRLFQEPASGRRRFLDRLVSATEPAHGREIAAHDAAYAQRMRLLTTGRVDAAWVTSLESVIAGHAVAITASRASFVRRLNQALHDGAAAGFPPAAMRLACPVATQLESTSALATEDWLRAALRTARADDARSGAGRHGAHRADMGLADLATGRRAELASTGECKALLLAVILGHAVLVGSLRGAAPILLLDEPMVHLDAERRDLLCAAASRIPAQIFLTGTDRASFAGLRAAATVIEARDGTIRP